jgi:hypothetical protein
MAELTLEILAARVAELEREVTSLKRNLPAVVPPSRDWRSVVGMFEDSDFMRQVDAEVLALRNAEQPTLSVDK